jgi:DNA polymerase III subunit delta'
VKKDREKTGRQRTSGPREPSAVPAKAPAGPAPAPATRICDWLIGQEEILGGLSRARVENRLAHAYLFFGPRGCGKTRTALAFAQELLCTSDSRPCGACSGCRRVLRLVHPDLHLIVPATRDEAEDPEGRADLLEAYAADRYHLLDYFDSASIGIDRIRSLKEEVAKSRVEADWRVVVLSGAGSMTEQAAQSALKLVEEPPPQTVLMLTAEDASECLPTLVSRCQRLRLRLLPKETLVRCLREELGLDETKARLFAALSGGSLGRALEMRSGDVLELRDRVLAAFDIPAKGLSMPEVERRVQGLERARATQQVRRAGELLLLWYEDLLGASAGFPPEALANADRAGDARREAGALDPTEIARRVRVVEEMIQAADQNVNPALALHAAITRTAARPGQEGYLI